LSKHFFLFMFIFLFTFNIALSGLFYYLHYLSKMTPYRKLAGCFLFTGLFMLFWYLSSYIVLNIYHHDTLFYTTMEALAFLWIGIAILQYLGALVLMITKTEQGQSILTTILTLATGILILTKYSYHIWGRNLAIFFWLKRLTALGLISSVMINSTILLFVKKELSIAFPKSLSKMMGAAGILLPVLACLDLFVIKDKFYEGSVKLSMNYPLFISGYLIFGLILAALLIRHLKLLQHPQLILETFSKKYQLTGREMEIVDLILKGKSNQEISDCLFISISTVKNHIHHIFEKLGTSSRVELISIVLSAKNHK
jgi:DNA-binding CsgD family transcriptional regulator